MKRKNSLFLFLILTILMNLTGCYDSAEVDSRAYPIAIAIDRIDDETVEIGLQFGKVIKASKGSSAQEEGNIVVKSKGANLFDAFSRLDNTTSKKINTSQLKVFIIGEDYATNTDIRKLIYSMENSYEGYPDMYVMVAKDSAIKYLDNQKVWLETTPSKYYELLYKKAKKSFLNIMTVSDIAMQSISENGAIVLPYINYINQDDKSKSKESSGGGEKEGGNSDVNIKLDEKTKKEFQDNNIWNITPSKSEIAQLAVFKKGKMIDKINREEIDYYGLLQGDFYTGYLNIPIDNNKKRYINMYIQNRVKPKVKAINDNGKFYFEIKLTIDVLKSFSVGAPEYKRDVMILEQIVEKTIEEEATKFLNKTKEINSDIINYGSYAKRNFKTINEFNEYGWDEEYKNCEFKVIANVRAFSTFLVIDENIQ